MTVDPDAYVGLSSLTSQPGKANVRPMLACPVPQTSTDRILLAHGEGARLTRRLIRELFLDAFANQFLDPHDDGAILPAIDGSLVMTTDSFVVSPLFFPGGDIGKLAVHGTVNDLAVCGGKPLYLDEPIGAPLPRIC